MDMEPYNILVPLSNGIDWSGVDLDMLAGRPVMVASLLNRPDALLERLGVEGLRVMHTVVDSPANFRRAVEIYHSIHTACHTLFRRVVSADLHRWYWLLPASFKPGPIMPDSLMAAVCVYAFESAVSMERPGAAKVYVIGDNRFLPCFRLPLSTTLLHSGAGCSHLPTSVKAQAGLRLLARSLLPSAGQPNGGGAIDCTFLVGNYWKDKGGSKIDMYFDGLPESAKGSGLTVESFSSPLTCYRYDRKCRIDRMLRVSPGDLVSALVLYRRIMRSLTRLERKHGEDLGCSDFLKDGSLIADLLVRNRKLLLANIILYYGYRRYVRDVGPKIICFYDEIAGSRKALQMAVDDLAEGRKPITVAFQHGWVNSTRFSHDFTVDGNERENPYPCADYYLVYNGVAKEVYSRLSHLLPREQVIVAGMHRIEDADEAKCHEYMSRLKDYRVKVLFIDDGEEYTREHEGMLSGILSMEKVALCVKPHPHFPSDRQTLDRLERGRNPASCLWFSEDFHLESIIKACDLVMVGSSTVFLNALYHDKTIIQTGLDDKRIDWYGVREGLQDVPGVIRTMSTEDAQQAIEHVAQTRNGGLKRPPGDGFIPSYLGDASKSIMVAFLNRIANGHIEDQHH